MTVITASPGKLIELGREGENLARQVLYDVSDWVAEYGEITVRLVAQLPGEEEPYPCIITVDGAAVTWPVTLSDTARAGYGRCELRCVVGDVLVKSAAWRTYTADALGTPTPEPPEPQRPWVDRVLSAEQTAQEAAERAVTASGRQPIIRDGTWWTWDIEAGAYKDTGYPILQSANVYTLETVTVPVSAWAQVTVGGETYYEAVVSGSDNIYTDSDLDVFPDTDPAMMGEAGRCGVLCYAGRDGVSYPGNAVIYRAQTVPDMALVYHVRVWAQRRLSYAYDSETMELTIMEE